MNSYGCEGCPGNKGFTIQLCAPTSRDLFDIVERVKGDVPKQESLQFKAPTIQTSTEFPDAVEGTVTCTTEEFCVRGCLRGIQRDHSVNGRVIVTPRNRS